MDKQRKRDNRQKKQNLQLKRHYRTTTPETSNILPQPATNYGHTSEDDEDNHFEMFDYVISNKLKQPESRFGSNPEEDNKIINDFEELANAAVSSGYFQFKSEKNWTEDISKYSELFAIDVKHLATVFNCIPFNQILEVDDKYFTKDQLTLFNTNAEHAEKNYLAELEEKLRLLQLKNQAEASDNPSDEQKLKIAENDYPDEDLEFLLSLKEPTAVNPVNTAFLSSKTNKEPKKSTNDPSTKSIDLEKWLDSVLDDDIS